MITFLIIFRSILGPFSTPKSFKNQSKNKQQIITTTHQQKIKILKFICVLQYTRALAKVILCQKIIQNAYKISSTTHLKTTSHFQHIFTSFRPPFRPQNPPKIYLKFNTSQFNTSQFNTSQFNTTHQNNSQNNTNHQKYTKTSDDTCPRWPHTSLY